MPPFSRYLIIKALLVGLVWQTHCVPTLPQGKIICVFDHQSGPTGAELGDGLYLRTNQVKDTVIETYSESEVRQFMEKIPELYKFKSTIFTDLDQRNSMKDDYLLMKNQLQRTKEQFHYTFESMKKPAFNQVSKNIQELTIQDLEAFQELIQEWICKMKDQGSHIQDIQILGIQDNGDLNKKEEVASPSSDTAFQRGLGLGLVEQISQRDWDDLVEELSFILHQIPFVRNPFLTSNKQQRLREGNELSLELQNLIFHQVGYLYKQKMISAEAFKEFFQSRRTLEIAALALIHHTVCSNTFTILTPVNVLNEWTSENYRNIYEVLDEKNKRYFSYMSLKSFDYTFFKIGNVELESLFKEDKLFNTLENLVYPQSRNSYSIMNSEQELRNQDTNYAEIKKSVQELISMFQDDGDDAFKKWNREWSFVFLHFIQNHYGFEIFGLEKGEKFEEKISLMSSSLQLWKELENISRYLKDEQIPGQNIQETQKKNNGEDILMIYKLFTYILSKNEILFSDPDMSIYCRTSRMKYLENSINDFITDIMHQNLYYLEESKINVKPRNAFRKFFCFL